MQLERFSTIHAHCASCYNISCTRVPDYSYSCELIECELGCDRIFHACKQKLHMAICRVNIVPCINKQNGCNLKIQKSDMAAHLLTCPANVVVCPNGDGGGLNPCNKVVRREEYAWHSLNVHGDNAINTRMDCPLCAFTSPKRSPMVPEGYIVHSPLLNSYGLVIGNKAFEANFENDNNDLNKEVGISCNIQQSQIWDLASYSVNIYPSLEDLPDNVLEYLLLFLDSFSLNNLSLTSKFLRHICKSVLDIKGMVEPVWSKTEGEGHTWDFSSWRWSFSTSFTPVRNWKYHLSTPLSEHLKACPLYPERVGNYRPNEIIECENKCGFSFTRLQEQEHKKRCQLENVNCINKPYGCPAVVRRSKMASHLRECPANIVKCPAKNMRPEMNGKCQRVFRREEMVGHQQFTHLDICDDTIMTCPLKNDGCEFSIAKRSPAKPKGEVIFDEGLKTFNVVQGEPSNVSESVNSQREQDVDDGMSTQYYRSPSTLSRETSSDKHYSYFENIPITLTLYIISLLDSISLGNLARTNTTFRDICESVLPEKGMVESVWQKSDTSSWIISKRKWYFSTACSPLQRWDYHLSTPISEHMKECSKFKDKNVHTQNKVLVMFGID